MWTEPRLHKGGKGPCDYSGLEQSSVWYQNLTDREKHLLLYWDTCKPFSLSSSLEELVDLNLSIGFSGVREGVSLCLAPNSRISLREKARWLLGVEKMQLMAIQRGSYPVKGVS